MARMAGLQLGYFIRYDYPAVVGSGSNAAGGAGFSEKGFVGWCLVYGV